MSVRESNGTSAHGLWGEAECSTLVDVLLANEKLSPERIPYRFLGHDLEETASLSYRQLFDGAQAVAHSLRHLEAQSRVILLFPTGSDFIIALYGVFLAGHVAVPVFPPNVNLTRDLERISRVCNDCDAAAVLTSATISLIIKSLGWLPGTPKAYSQVISVDAIIRDGIQERIVPSIDASSIALLQYSSGSTGHPKGVILSHGNLMSHMKIIYEGLVKASVKQSRILPRITKCSDILTC